MTTRELIRLVQTADPEGLLEVWMFTECGRTPVESISAGEQYIAGSVATVLALQDRYETGDAT